MKKPKRKITGKRTLHDRLKEELHDPEFRSAYEEADLPVRLAIQIAKATASR
jgi:hypothetical protein